MISLAASAARTSCTSESRLIVSFPVLWPARSVREGEVCARQSPARRSRTSGRGNDRVQGYRQDKCGLGGLVRSRVGVTCRAPRGPGRPGAKSPTPGLRLVRSLRTTSSGPSRALRPAGAIKGQLSRSVTPQTLRDRKQLLKELEEHGFLVRERERGPDGTLGAAVYFITDLPALQSHRSPPESGYPPVDEPTLVNRPTKNTNRKKTNKQNELPRVS